MSSQDDYEKDALLEQRIQELKAQRDPSPCLVYEQAAADLEGWCSCGWDCDAHGFSDA